MLLQPLNEVYHRQRNCQAAGALRAKDYFDANKQVILRKNPQQWTALDQNDIFWSNLLVHLVHCPIRTYKRLDQS